MTFASGDSKCGHSGDSWMENGRGADFCDTLSVGFRWMLMVPIGASI